MKKLEDIQSLTYYKERLFLPYLDSNKMKGTCIFTINTSKESICNLLSNHFIISNNGTYYNAYWYDYEILPKCIKSVRVKNSKLTVINAKKNRLADYESINTILPSVKTPITLSSLSGKNFVYDLQPMVELYDNQPKLKTINIKEQVKVFFDTLVGIYSKPIDGYTKSCIFVDLDEYNKTTNVNSHVLYNVLMLLRRNQKIIDSIGSYDMKFLFFTNSGYFLFDCNTDIKKTNIPIINKLLKKLNTNLKIDKDIELGEQKEIQRIIAQNAMKDRFVGAEADIMKFTGDGSESDSSEEISNSDNITDEDEQVVQSVKNEIEDLDELSKDEKEIFSNEELKREYLDAVTSKNTGRSKKTKANTERDKLLREKQKDIKVMNHTIGEISKMKDIPKIKEVPIDNDNVTNPNMKTIKFSKFEETYMDTLYEKDISNCITSLNDKPINVNIIDIKVEDTSDSLTMKETYTVTLEDEYRKRHTLKFNLPKFIDNKFIYVNGNKKSINKQLFLYPVIKTGPDEVQICTNYQKIFINRVGVKFNQNTERFRKLLESPNATISLVRGCNTSINKDYLTCLEYDEFAKQFNSIRVGSATFVFNMKELVDMFDGKEKSDLDKILVGYETKSNKKNPIYYDRRNSEHDDFVSLMVSYASPEVREQFDSYTTGKKYIHAKATIMTEHIPIVVLLCFFEGLETVIRKFNTLTNSPVMFSDKKDKGKNYQYIKFSDGYLCYPLSNMEACVMFNGFTEFNTGVYSFNEMNDRTTYLDIFDIITNRGSYLAGGLLNYYEWMIDPITLEILQELDYPTDFVSLAIYATNLLADNSYINDINLENYRLRDNEIIAAILYKNIARSYSRYKATVNNPNPVKISMDEDAVIKELVTLPTVEDYSTLSPMVELHKSGLASMKGPNGMNLDRAYKVDKRAYDDSMTGVFGISTDAGPNVGKDRHLVAEPTIINARGFIDVKGRENADKLKDVNLSTPVEMLTPMTSTRDEPARVSMSTKQTSHVIPVEGNCPALISTGMDIMAHYRTGSDFSIVATDDGKVVDIDESVNIMIVKYKNGETQAIDLSPHVVKNGGGGFYLANQLTSKVKKGQSFKKDDILAYDKRYYKDIGKLGNRITVGSLMKVMTMSNYATYEDSTFITKYMSKRCATNITMPKSVKIGANANVDFIVKVGQYINIGDDLIRYETSYDDSELNRLLANVRDDMKEEIVNLGKSSLTSSYTGIVQDIQIISTVELDELSPSLRKIVKDYQDNVKKRKKYLNNYDPDGKDSVYRMGIMMDKADSRIVPDRYGKVKGQDLGKGVLIDFFVTYHDEPSDGDKFAAFTANKNTVGYVVPEGYEPYSEFRPNEEISSVVAPSAILQRGTPSIMTTGCAYKVLIELKRKMYEILTGHNYDEVLKQKQPWMNKDEQPTTESTMLESITESQILLYENIFDLYRNDDGLYYSNKYIVEDSVIMSIPQNVDISPMLEHFSFNKMGNAYIDDDIIRASKNISPNELISLRI